MDILHAIVLSIVEGISEFLPISSTGHMILASDLLRVPQTDFVKSFEIIIQLGAILAVVLLYWKKLLTNKNVFMRVSAAFVPTAIIGFALYKLIKTFLLGNTIITLWALLLGGIALILIEKLYKEQPHHLDDIAKLSYKNAVIIGLVQALSVIPGVSRSGATIVGGLFTGLKRKAAVEFSFMLSIPTMVAATGLDVVKENFAFTGQEWGVLAVGFIGAFITAFFTVKYFLKFVEKHTFIGFGIYRIVVALIFWFFIIK